MKIEILGNKINEEKDFHSQLSKILNIQEYYGNNLDALWDLFSVGIEHPIHLVWKDASESQTRLGEQFTRIIDILERVKLQDEQYKWEDKLTYSLE